MGKILGIERRKPGNDDRGPNLDQRRERRPNASPDGNCSVTATRLLSSERQTNRTNVRKTQTQLSQIRSVTNQSSSAALITQRIKSPIGHKITRQLLIDDRRSQHLDRNPILLQKRIVVGAVRHLA